MISLQRQRRRIPRPARALSAHPTFDRLEDRMLLYSTIGGAWTQPVRITYSIVPDGTSIGGTPSNLNQEFASKPGWQQEIRKAAAAWGAVTGINFVQVPDNGAPIGSGGYQQGDPASGDIRIGGMTQSGSQLAFAFAPPPLNGGPLAGDIFFNTDQSWQVDGTTYDLLTVAVHEFGHALGMGHSAISSAVMYATYLQAKQSLTPDDTAGIQSIYGGRNPDHFDASASNNSYQNSTIISAGDDGQVALANLDVSTRSDVDWYKVTAPASTTGAMAVRMQASALSSIIPRVTVYNGSLQPVADSIGTDYGSTVSVSVGVTPGQTWYIKAMAGTTGSAGIGAYGLLVNFGPNPQGPIAPPNTVVPAQPDQNPTTTTMGEGWEIEGQFIPYLGLLGDVGGVLEDVGGVLGGVVGGVLGDLGDVEEGLHRIVYGTLSGYGDTLGPDKPAGHGHDHGGASGVGEANQVGSRWGRGTLPSGATSDAAINPPVVDLGADDTQGRPWAMGRRWAGFPVRNATGRLRAVDAAASSWRPTAWPRRLDGPPVVVSHQGTLPRVLRMIAYNRPPNPS